MQARNIMRDEMRLGDQAFFYHSSCKVNKKPRHDTTRHTAITPGDDRRANQPFNPTRRPTKHNPLLLTVTPAQTTTQVPGIVGVVEIVKEAHPDHFQFVRTAVGWQAWAG